jgi:iron complex outermembrane receptor protein
MMQQTMFSQNTLKGKIISKTNNEPLGFANVYIPELSKGTQTDSNGEFIMKNLPNKKFKIQVSFIGYQTVIQTIFTNTEDTLLNIALEPSILQTEEIVVSGGIHSTQHENAIKIDLINSKDISSIGSPSFIEALTNIPGVDMIAKGSGVAQPVIRGLSKTNILMLNNGIKMENFQFSSSHPYMIDEFGVDRVEIIKGPASLLYGSNAVGGVVNVIKEKPAPTGVINGDYNMQYHTNTKGWIGNMGVKGTSESIFWGIRGGIKSHGDYKDGNGDYVPNTRFNENSIKANIGLQKNFGVFRIYYDYNRPKLGMCVSSAIDDITENGRENKVWYQDLTNHIIASRNTLFLEKYKVDINASYQMNNRRLQTDEDMATYQMVDMDMNTLSYEVKTSLPSNEVSEYIIGLQGANKTNRNNDTPSHVIPDADVNDFSLFTLIQYSFFEKLKIQAGLRYDFRSISTEEETDKEAVDTDYDDISTSIGATYNISPKFLLRTNLASAFRTPNIAELTQNGWHDGRYEVGDSELDSQRSYEADLSVHFHSKYIMFDISGFYNRINNYIYISPTDETTDDGYSIYQYMQNNSKLYGGELLADIQATTGLNINAGYNYLIGKQDDGNYLPYIPQNKLRLGIKLQKEEMCFLRSPFFKIGGLYAWKQNNPSIYETETDGYFLLNAGVGTDLKIGAYFITFSAQANNLLNEKYYDHLSTLKDLDYYNIGRNISFNVQIPFKLK